MIQGGIRAFLSILLLAAGYRESTAASRPGQLSIPTDLRPHVDRSISVGRLMFSQDRASAIATDLLAAKLGTLDGQGLGGYLAVAKALGSGPSVGGWEVLFFSEGIPRVLYRIGVGDDRASRPNYRREMPPAPIVSENLALIAARQSAIAAVGSFTRPVNPIVLSEGAGSLKRIVVYLMAGTTTPNVAVLGRHYRVNVSQDGRTVEDVLPLSKTELELPLSSPTGGRPEALFVTHVLTDYPLESHVFASLLNSIPIVVETARGRWLVAGDSISLLPTPKPPSESPGVRRR